MAVESKTLASLPPGPSVRRPEYHPYCEICIYLSGEAIQYAGRYQIQRRAGACHSHARGTRAESVAGIPHLEGAGVDSDGPGEGAAAAAEQQLGRDR